MHNMVYLIGRLTKDVEVMKGENVKDYSFITLAVQRSYKNEEGIYETDFIPVRLFGALSTNTAEYCRKGDLVGIKGNLQVYEDKLCVIADKITFLSSKKSKDEE